MLKWDCHQRRRHTKPHFDNDRLVRRVSNPGRGYEESQYDLPTQDRETLLPVGKGKSQKLTPSTLSKRKPQGAHLTVDPVLGVCIANETTQTTLYSSEWELEFVEGAERRPEEWIEDFIGTAPAGYLQTVKSFNQASRRHQKFKAGDIFAFGVGRSQWGFGRVLWHLDKVRKSGLLPEVHAARNLMGPPVLVQILRHVSDHKAMDFELFDRLEKLPSDYMMDNRLLYGQYEVIAHRQLREEEIDFAASSFPGHRIIELRSPSRSANCR